MSPTARVGAFMLVALVVLGVFIIKIEELPLGSKGGRSRVKAEFVSVAGLDEKSPVRIAGVRIGIVEGISLEGDRAIVTLALEPGVQLHRGARAEVTSLGMLGDKYVELYPGDLHAPLLDPETVLVGDSPVGFDKVLKTVGEVGDDVKAVTGSLRQSLGGPEGQRRLDEIVENIRQLTAEVKAMVAANRTNVDATLTNFKDFSETLKTELPKLAEKLNSLADRVDTVVAENREGIKGSVDNIKDLSGRLRASADNINEITGKIARGEGSIGKLVNDEETVNNLNSTLKSVESGVNSLKNTVGRAERWKLDMNVRSEYLPGLDINSKSRSTLGFDLHTSDVRFFRVELVSTPFGRLSKHTDTVTVTYPDGHSETTVTTKSQESDASSVNAQVGYHYGPYTLRAGLFESTGGVGLDRDVIARKLRVSFEAFDFNRDTKPPHLRLEGRYYFTKNLFGYAGWDDPVWKQHSSVLFGGGVTWGDEDVKYLLGTAASVGSAK
ncbi:MAG: MCE family protein [Thermoanaerobaculaceae bacterium]|nr:MCE family protein [Thermoanaerobaculaceae bacterium]MDI9621576.1 MlaD family protein [Acidobacteriota bacterium]